MFLIISTQVKWFSFTERDEQITNAPIVIDYFHFFCFRQRPWKLGGERATGVIKWLADRQQINMQRIKASNNHFIHCRLQFLKQLGIGICLTFNAYMIHIRATISFWSLGIKI